jgi:hypothetical protein
VVVTVEAALGGKSSATAATSQVMWLELAWQRQSQQPTQTETSMVTQLLMQGVEDLMVEESYQSSQSDGWLPKMWILLDNQSMVNIFYSKVLLTNVQPSSQCMHMCCNAGWAVMNIMIGCLHGYPGELWYNPKGIANILSLADTENILPMSAL